MKNKFEKPCKNCPFQKGMQWYGAYGSGPNVVSKIEALQETDKAGVFSCHMKNPDNNVFRGNMVNNDCAGFKMMLENMNEPGKHKKIVDTFNEIGPDYNLAAWAKHEGYQSKLGLI